MNNSSPQAIATGAVTAALSQMPDVMELAQLFKAAGFEFAIVGGPVRDLILNREITDLDFTTNAQPEQILNLVTPWADTIWEIGIAFGNVGAEHVRRLVGQPDLQRAVGVEARQG